MKNFLEKKGSKIYFNYQKESTPLGYFLSVAGAMTVAILICLYIWSKEEINSFIKIILSCCVIVFMILSVLNNIFFSNYDYHINLITRKIIFSNGRLKHKKEIVLDFEQIKNIVLIEKMENTEGGAFYWYQIDIYDNDLNAYKICSDTDHDKINKVALEIKNIIEAEIVDWTHIENYEGFRKRLI